MGVPLGPQSVDVPNRKDPARYIVVRVSGSDLNVGILPSLKDAGQSSVMLSQGYCTQLRNSNVDDKLNFVVHQGTSLIISALPLAALWRRERGDDRDHQIDERADSTERRSGHETQPTVPACGVGDLPLLQDHSLIRC